MLIIELEGGIIQNILMDDKPFSRSDGVMVIDYDCVDSVDEEDIVSVPYKSTHIGDKDAYVYEERIVESHIDLAKLKERIKI